MKKVLFSAAMALMLVSCAHDEVIEINRDGDEIQFNVVSDAATRAENVYCNNNMPTEFRVWAERSGVTDGSPSSYIDGDVIKRQGDAAPYTWKNTSGVRYWPEGNMRFLAEVNAGDALKWNEGDPIIENYTVPTDVKLQKDLLIAEQDASKNDGQVLLNFRHVLSQIVFQARNTNANLYVEISGVTICNLANTGTYILGEDTEGNRVNHEGKELDIVDKNTWMGEDTQILSGGNIDYPVKFTPVPVPGDNKPKSLTNTNDTGKEFSSNAMLLLPQVTRPWAPADGNGKPGKETQTGTYFLVDCKICNVEGEEYAATDVVLWNGPVAIPAGFNWSEGKKYIYTFVFGDGNGGFDPDPDPNDPDPDPEPVLTPITFDVTVDDFVPVANKDYQMQTNN